MVTPIVSQIISTTADELQDTSWFAQTFKPDITFELNTIDIKAYRTGTIGTVTISIRNTTAGLPSGSDLASGTFDGNTLTTNTTFGQILRISDLNLTLTKDTTYAIVVRAPDQASNQMGWLLQDPGNYPDGSYISSSNSGGSWSADTTFDFYFILYTGSTGGRGTRHILTNFPTESGLESLEKQEGRKPNLVAEKGTHVRPSTSVGMGE